MKISYWALALLSGPILPLFAQNLPKTMLHLPDTGQNQDFTATPGEDSDYSIYAPGFLLNGDGTVTDTVTGLMWQQGDGGEMTIESAESYCENLVLGGYGDWRLPTAQEAFSILHHGKQNPPLDLSVFLDTGAEYWWTGERQAGNTTKVWVTNAGGGIGNHPKTETISAGGTKRFQVRAVRDIAPPPVLSEQFVIADSTVIDQLSGLEWQRFVSQDSMNWESALLRAENFVLGGKSDWRLPNIKELESINDETRTQPSLQQAAFGNLGVKKLWSSTSLPNQALKSWFMDTKFGVISYDAKTLKNYVLLVRGPVGATTAAAEVDQSELLRVFPNPCGQCISLHFSAQGLERVQRVSVSDALGRVVYESDRPKGEHMMIRHLKAGVYGVICHTAVGAICRKVVVEQ